MIIASIGIFTPFTIASLLSSMASHPSPLRASGPERVQEVLFSVFSRRDQELDESEEVLRHDRTNACDDLQDVIVPVDEVGGGKFGYSQPLLSTPFPCR